MPPSATTAGTDRLLSCSPARIVYTSIDPASGQPFVGKIFVSGAMADAEREVAMGRLADGPGVVHYDDVALDLASNRPRVTMRFEPGTNLDALVAERGALPAALVCRLMAPVAATLARLHGSKAPDAPHGMCHGDVKPKNLLRTATTTLLLDFEHARLLAPPGAATAAEPTFTGGSRAFAPPEAHDGAVPDGAFDVYGIGATMQWLATLGGQTQLPQHPDFETLVAECLAAQVDRRPSAAALTSRLDGLAAILEQDPGEALLDDWATASLGANATEAADPRTRLWQRRRRLARSLPRLLEVPSALPTDPVAILRELNTAARVLRLFPRHGPTLRWRRDLTAAAGRLLAGAAQHVTNLGKSEDFDAAREWLRALEQLARVALALPGGCAIPVEDSPASVALLHRDPIAFVQLLARRLEASREELVAETAAITAAEQRLDLRAAERAIEQMAVHYGGASPTVARRRDQLHRLGFYVDRVARAEPNVERMSPLWDAVALQPLSTFVAAAAACKHHARGEQASGAVGLRSLQITLANLAEEFPHLAQVGPALDTLSHALAHLTDQAWDLLAEAQQRLRVVPVPVRPLQLALGRLDTFRVLEALVDREGRPRSQLQDGIEALRLSLEQARATRDRLAEGAENALARGHWTTGLFDMERAVAGLNPVDEHEKAHAARLQQRLDEVRRRKQEVEGAVRRNVELTTRYGTLQDDPSSTFAGRLQVLGERRDCLHFLTMHVPAERGVLYSQDLRDVETQIALEQASFAEHQLDGTVDPTERLRLARATVDRLSNSMAAADQGIDAPGRVVRLLEHWHTVAAHCQRALDQQQAERQAQRRQRQRFWAMAVGAFLVSSTAIGLALRPWFGGQPANASDRAAAGDLAQAASTLPVALRDDAASLCAAAVAARTSEGAFDHRAWHANFRQQLLQFVGRCRAAGSPSAATAFAAACWRAGLDAADERLDDAGRADLRLLTQALVDEVPAPGLQPLPARR